MTCCCGKDDKKLTELKQFIQEHKQKKYFKSYLIKVLHKAQGLYGYLNKDVINEIAKEMKISVPRIWGVITFYHYFNLTPPGKHTVSLCMGTACYVKGAENILAAIKKELKIEVGQTTQDKLFTLQETRCLGTCGLAPVIMIDDKVYGNLTAKKVAEILESYKIS